MKKDYIQMIMAVAVLSFVLSSGLSFKTDTAETAIVSNAIQEPNIKPNTTEEVAKNETVLSEGETEPDIISDLGSLDENELEKEYGNVQSGIDLLDNPL